MTSAKAPFPGSRTLVLPWRAIAFGRFVLAEPPESRVPDACVGAGLRFVARSARFFHYIPPVDVLQGSRRNGMPTVHPGIAGALHRRPQGSGRRLCGFTRFGWLGHNAFGWKLLCSPTPCTNVVDAANLMINALHSPFTERPYSGNNHVAEDQPPDCSDLNDDGACQIPALRELAHAR